MPIKKVLIDLSGTLHIDNQVTGGAVEALKRLRESNISVKFVTNTTKESRRILFNRLKSLGFELESNEIFTSLTATRDFVKQNELNPLLLVDEKALEDFADVVHSDKKQDSVVIGLAPNSFKYDVLNNAFRLLKSGGKLIAIHQARYFKEKSGLSLGPGCFVKGLEYSADCKAHTIGKPSEEFFLAALEGTQPSEAVMIGDDARDDVGGAQAINIKGILVKTGKYTPGDESLITPLPMATVENFSAAVDLIIQNNSI
ncbi:hypothetical protein V9T40_012093 [Parthenolecanium corni]|uniref:Haloacid dehalogenase-like hydrolase domain-containing protein 2 n=1 Tax=Parthenolecanium corni TaxID=536013 RepID=A0AAN9XZ07_9HEMI